MNPETEKYINGLRNGNTNLIVQLYKEVFPNVKRYILKMGGSPEDAAEIYQQTIIKLYELCLRPNFSLDRRVQGYLYMMCRNLWIDTKKSEKKMPLDSIEGNTLLDHLISQKEDTDQSADVRMEAKRLGKALQSLLKSLGEKCQTALELRFFQDLSFREVAAKLRIKENAARQVVFKCNKKMGKAVLDSPHLDDLMDYFKFSIS